MGSYTLEKLYDQEIHTVSIPESTRLSGGTTPELIAEAAAFLHKDGIIILENAIDKAHIDTLNNKLSTEALEIADNPNHHFNFGKETRNMDQAPHRPHSSCLRTYGATPLLQPYWRPC